MPTEIKNNRLTDLTKERRMVPSIPPTLPSQSSLSPSSPDTPSATLIDPVMADALSPGHKGSAVCRRLSSPFYKQVHTLLLTYFSFGDPATVCGTVATSLALEAFLNDSLAPESMASVVRDVRSNQRFYRSRLLTYDLRQRSHDPTAHPYVLIPRRTLSRVINEALEDAQWAPRYDAHQKFLYEEGYISATHYACTQRFRPYIEYVGKNKTPVLRNALLASATVPSPFPYPLYVYQERHGERELSAHRSFFESVIKNTRRVPLQAALDRMLTPEDREDLKKENARTDSFMLYRRQKNTRLRSMFIMQASSHGVFITPPEGVRQEETRVDEEKLQELIRSLKP